MPKAGFPPAIVVCAAVAAFGCRGGERATGPQAITWAARDAAIMRFESPLEVVRFGTPASEPSEAHGFERVPGDVAREPSAGLRRRAEILVRFAEVAPRRALLDLDLPPGGERSARVMLNGHRVMRLDARPGRRRYAIPLPAERQAVGGNTLGLVFAEPVDAQRPPRVFGLAVGPPSPVIDAALRSPYPFTVWAEGNDVLQAGPSRVAWAVESSDGAHLEFATAALGQSRPRMRVEVEEPGTAPRRVWEGEAGAAGRVALGGPGVRRVWLHVEAAEGEVAWARWNGLRVAGPAAPPAPTPPPGALSALRARLASANVLVIVLDAAGAGHFGSYGAPRATTPEIDRLAAEGALFERAYTPAVFTRSAMASVWTSQLPDEHHATVSYDDKLPESVPTLAGIVSAAGIATAAFVGNNMAGEPFGLDRGFAEFHRASRHAHALNGSAQGWLAGNAHRRFFAYLHFREPHYPFDPPPPYDTLFGPDAPLPASVKTDSSWLDRVNEGSHRPSPEEIDHLRRLYDGNLRAVDAEIGRLRKFMEAAGLWDRTVVLLTADHGEALFEHGFVGHNEQLYEESVRVPMIVRLPPGAAAGGGRRISALASLLDVAPTVADALGIPPAGRPSFRGRSLLAEAAGVGTVAAEPVLCRTVGSKPRYALVGPRYKYTYNTRDGDESLHDLERDPEERRDVAAEETVRAEHGRQRLFARLLSLPGRARAGGEWKVTPAEAEEMRALGYVQ